MLADYNARSRTPILGAIVALHVLTLATWQATRRTPAPRAHEDSMQWVWIQPDRETPAAAPPAVQPPPPAARPRPARRPAPVPAAPVAPQAITVPAVPALPEAAAPSVPDDPFNLPAAPAAAPDLVTAARKAAGKIDQDLRKEQPRRPERRVELGPQQRFANALGQAAAQRWDGAATITEDHMPNGMGDRIYRIKTPFGTYCARYTPPRAGIDEYERGRNAPKITSCPH